MIEDLYKLCPECGGEYQYTVAACVDCGVPLVLPEEIAFRNARELPLSPGLVRLRTAPILWVRALAADLARAGIPYAVDRRKAREEGLLSLYVRGRDLEEGAALDAVYGPGDAAEEPARDERRETRDEPAYKVCPECGGEYRLEIERGPFERLKTRACLYLRPMDCEAAEDLMASPEEEIEVIVLTARACPACGTGLQSGASACPACGLVFDTPEEVPCPRCGATLDASSTGVCPNCGSALGER